MSTIRECLTWGELQLSALEMAKLESQILLAHTLACDRSQLYAWPEKAVTPEQEKLFQSLIVRRQQHEPIAYLVSKKEFWSLPFEVNQNTLIPRQDTERLVQKILEVLPNTSQKIVDVGTGSGNIACALAYSRPQWEIWAVDLSYSALQVARKNAQSFNLSNIVFLQTSWLAGLPLGNFDAVVGNPPYIRSQDVHLMYGDLPFEPKMALTPGPTGLESFQALLPQAKLILKPGGWVMFEHGFDQGEALRELMSADFVEVQTFQDASGNDRVTVGSNKKAQPSP